MPIWFQVRPKSVRLICTSASRLISPASTEAWASKVTGLVWSRTVRPPDTVTPWPEGVTWLTVKVMSGWVSLSKKSADRRCVSRLLFLVSTEAAATVTLPVTSPAGETVPCPVTWRKTPFTGTRPHMLLLFSPTVDLDESRVQDPARAASFSSACRSGVVACPDEAMMSSSSIRFRYVNSFDIGTIYIRVGPVKGGTLTEETGSSAHSAHSALCLRLMQLFPRVSRGMRRWQDRSAPPTPAPLGPRHVAALEQLRGGPVTVSELAARLGLTLPTVSGVLADLDRAGLVSRQPDPADRRRTIVQVNPAQAALVGQWLDGAAGPLARVLDQLAPSEQAAFLKAMDLLETELRAPGGQ